MSASDSLTVASPPSATQPNPVPRDTVAEIDASCRWPLLLLLIGAVKWLALGTTLSIIANIKFHSPDFLADCSWLTFGRVRPAAMNALLYGFGSQAGLGVLLWMMSRLGGERLNYQVPLCISGLFWNLGVLIGVLGILAGDTTGFEWLEMPAYASPLLLVAFLVIALCALVNLHYRTERSLYVSQWYLLAALFCFSWIYSTAHYLLVFDPVRGTLQAAIAAWFGNNLLGMWLTPIGLAAIFYFIPKLTGRPLHNYWLAVFGFWTLVVFTNWSGLTPLIGGPVPRWMPSVSVVANLLLVVPIVAVGLNWYLTVKGELRKVRTDLVFRFVLAGAACYLLAGLLGAVLGLREASVVTQFTFMPVARTQLVLHGFISLTLLGSFYYILPRVTGIEWPSAKLVRFHFIASLTGLAFIVVPLLIGGLLQGVRMKDPSVDFLSISKLVIPFVGNATLGLTVLLAGQVALGWNLFLLLRRYCEKSCLICEWLECCGPGAAGRKP